MQYFKNDDTNLLFIHIPKTGGSSVKLYFSVKYNIPLKSSSINSFMDGRLAKNLGINPNFQHFTYDIIMKNKDSFKIDTNNIKIITIVRNPYERIISDLMWFKFINNKSSKEEVYNKILFYLNENIDNHGLPQYLFIIDENKQINNNIQILHTETLNNDMIQLGNIDFDVRANCGSKINCYDFLNDESIDIINAYYNKDFELFNYHKIITTEKNGMKIISQRYLHFIKNNENIVVNLSYERIYKLYIVYYINCFTNINYFDWLLNQIKMVYQFNGIIYIIATLNITEESQFKQKVTDIYPNVIIECTYVNEYEYPGILKVWELGQIHNKENDILLYFHSKGATHHKNYEGNRNDKYNIILKDIDKIKEIFTIFPSIDKIGYYSGGIGWIWYNFWYARGSYINMVEKPVKTQRRHYYEDWLSRKVKKEDQICENERSITYYENTIDSCYGFFNDANFGNIGSRYDPNINKMVNNTLK